MLMISVQADLYFQKIKKKVQIKKKDQLYKIIFELIKNYTTY